jgi:hypothetical protein
MISPDQIRRRANAQFYEWLAEVARTNAPFAPVVLDRLGDKLDAPDRYAQLEAITAHSKSKIGYGYRIELEPPRPGSKVQQSRIRALVWDTEADLLRFLGAEDLFRDFKNNLERIQREVPALRDWCPKNVKKIVDYAAFWPQLIAVVRFFEENPAPDVASLRLLPINGVDTKFIERHSGILSQLLDVVLPPERIDRDQPLFSRRYRLPEPPSLVECFWNDPTFIQRFMGGTGLSVPINDFLAHELPFKRVIIVENRASVQQLLSRPLPDTLVIFGSGWRVNILRAGTWLQERTVYYWGDLDTHGLAILSSVRGFLPHVIPLMMDEATFEAHSAAWVQAADYTGATPLNLTPDEVRLFERLKAGRLRLEQERVELVFEG